MKGQYNIYPMLSETASKEMRKSGTFDPKANNEQCIKELFMRIPEMHQSLNYTVISEEFYWADHSRVVIFPESCEILERLSEAKMDISKSAGISFPHDCFFLAFPKDFKLAGTPAHGCMISYMNVQQRFEKIHVPFFKQMGLGRAEFVDNEHDLGLYFAYFNPFEKNMLIRASIPVEIIAKCLQAKSAYEYGALVGNFSRDKIKDFIPLNDQDLDYQFALFQIITRIGVYTTSCDTALRAGYPHVRPKHLEPKGMTYVDYTVGLSNETRTVGAHYRSWYFRQLTHKKYYQGQHAKKPIGSRIVFVKDTMVSLNVEAETLE